MITFYPGPSKIYPSVGSHLQAIYQSGLLSMNHRSGPFMEMLAATTATLKEKLAIPSEYEVYYTSSATECWEIVGQSLIANKSIHLHNGAFGAKWAEYTGKLQTQVTSIPFSLEQFPEEVLPNTHTIDDTLCITHCETSNGYLIPEKSMNALRNAFDGIIAVDATASMAGVAINWKNADVWFASIQKCFGLPSGLAVMVVSPAALARAQQVSENDHYNSLLFIAQNFQKNQTPYTPNILGIALLGKVAQEYLPISETHRITAKRSEDWYSFLKEYGYSPLLTNNQLSTVLTVSLSPETVKLLKAFAASRGIMIGNGYGSWKENSFRIANFPAILDTEIADLQTCLKDFKDEFTVK